MHNANGHRKLFLTELKLNAILHPYIFYDATSQEQKTYSAKGIPLSVHMALFSHNDFTPIEETHDDNRLSINPPDILDTPM